MASPSNPGIKLRFDVFEFDPRTGELWKHGVPLRLQDQPARILRLLLSRPGELVSRDEIRCDLWHGDVFVDYEHGLHRAINKLRDVLSDSVAQPRFIETRARAGYRFIARVSFAADLPIQVSLEGSETDVTPPGDARLATNGPVPLPVIAVPESLQTREPQRVPRSVLKVIKGFALLTAAFVVLMFGIASLRNVQQQSFPASDMRLRQLTANSSENPVRSGAVSADGKYLAYSDLDGIHIALIDTGETQTVPQPYGLTGSRVQWDIAAWFPDNTRLVANLNSSDAQLPSIWTVPVLGGAPRKLRENAEAWSVSPNGSQIAFAATYRPCGPREVRLMDPDGAQERKLIDVGKKDAITGAQFSADGQRVLYIRYVEKLDKSIVESLDLRSRRQTTILPSTDRLVDHLWLPDGRLIYALAEENNRANCNYWTVQIDLRTGRPGEKPHRLSNWGGFCVSKASATADGKRLAFLESSGQTDVYLAQLIGNGGHIITASHVALEGESNPLAWTADSKAIVFQWSRNGRAGIFKQALNARAMEPIVVSNKISALGARVSPDGRWIVYVAAPDAGPLFPASLMRVGVDGGASYSILQAPSWDFRCARSPANFCAFSGQTPDGKQLIFTAFDPIRGRDSELARLQVDPEANYDWALSPDGSLIVVRKNKEARLTILSLSSQTSREIAVDGWSTLENLDWAPDSKGLFTSALMQTGAALLHVDLDGNSNVVWQRKGSEFTVGIPSPDGRHVALAAWGQKANMWTMEDFR